MKYIPIIIVILFLQVGLPILDFIAVTIDAVKDLTVSKLSEHIAESNCKIARMQNELDVGDPQLIGFSIDSEEPSECEGNEDD